MFESALGVATATLAALERRMELPAGWFETNMGPVAENSQWHVKRYRPEARSEHAVALAEKSADDEKSGGGGGGGGVDKSVLLAVHTDPSLISVVLHDAPGVQSGAVGLEYLSAGGAGQWTEVPHHGGVVPFVRFLYTRTVISRVTMNTLQLTHGA